MTRTGSSWLHEPLRTDRLRLRAVTTDDVPFLLRLWTDSEVRRYLGGPRPTGTLRRAAQEHIDAYGVFVVTTTADATSLGAVSLGPYARTGETEVSYTFLPEHWGHGYAREAVATVLDWGFDHLSTVDVPRIIAVTQEANRRSRRLLKSLGMTLTDRFVEFDAPQTMYALDRPRHGGERGGEDGGLVAG